MPLGKLIDIGTHNTSNVFVGGVFCFPEGGETNERSNKYPNSGMDDSRRTDGIGDNSGNQVCAGLVGEKGLR